MFCPASYGGIADYAHEQAMALGHAGWKVTVLCPPGFSHQSPVYRKDTGLPDDRKRGGIRLQRIFKVVRGILSGVRILDERIAASGTRNVLMATYSEYLAPLWAWRFRKWKKQGVVFGAVAHDPVRDFVVGPLWWHRWSISEGYSFLRHVFVHESIELDTGSRKLPVETHVIPHGPYPFPAADESSEQVRLRLGIPQSARVFLSFGHLRNGKNLNLILEAMREIPDAWLLVAGSEAGSGHTTSAEYQAMAEGLGVEARCRWVIGFASEPQVAGYFTAADFALLTYQATFRSASGVLNVAVHFRKLVLASCGESNLASSVERYQLGVRVPADETPGIVEGMRKLLEGGPRARWEDYERENSWQRNAELVTEAFEISAEKRSC